MRLDELEKLPRIRRIGLDQILLAWHAAVDEENFRTLAASVNAKGGRLVALWGSDNLSLCQVAGIERGQPSARFSVHAAFYLQVHAEFIVKPGLLWVSLDVPDDLASFQTFPSLSGLFPAAARMERAIHDLLGVGAVGGLAEDRPWLRHGAWPADQFPLRKDFPAPKSFASTPDDYPFVRVQGEGVHEIPVGPVHAGIIEPGHFRFQVVGEKILRLEERLGYKHKGIEKRFENMDFMTGARLAGRISGDSTVAHTFAYALAIEHLTESKVPPRAVWLRALCLERERIANHLGDLGALGNDAGLAFGLAQFSRLKEGVLRINHKLSGHRYLMDVITPGGLARDFDDDGVELIEKEAHSLLGEIDRLQEIYEEHAGLQDRLANTGQVTPELASRLGLIGVAGRASGQPWDLRVQCPVPPYSWLKAHICTHQDGDVDARVAVRFGELRESLRLQKEILAQLPEGTIHTPLNAGPPWAAGIGWVEGWRGEVFTWVRADDNNRIDRCHPQDPSWVLWPALEYAVLGNIVPDFPLINKSFNLSYSGHDL